MKKETDETKKGQIEGIDTEKSDEKDNVSREHSLLNVIKKTKEDIY